MRLPRDLSGEELAKGLAKLGCEVTRQSGSHLRLRSILHGEHHVTIPRHRALRTGTLAAVLAEVAEHHGMEREVLIQRLFG